MGFSDREVAEFRAQLHVSILSAIRRSPSRSHQQIVDVYQNAGAFDGKKIKIDSFPSLSISPDIFGKDEEGIRRLEEEWMTNHSSSILPLVNGNCAV